MQFQTTRPARRTGESLSMASMAISQCSEQKMQQKKSEKQTLKKQEIASSTMHGSSLSAILKTNDRGKPSPINHPQWRSMTLGFCRTEKTPRNGMIPHIKKAVRRGEVIMIPSE